MQYRKPQQHTGDVTHGRRNQAVVLRARHEPIEIVTDEADALGPIITTAHAVCTPRVFQIWFEVSTEHTMLMNHHLALTTCLPSALQESSSNSGVGTSCH